jgi:hypothetical protein
MTTRSIESLDHAAIFAEFGLPPDGFLIAEVQINQWGRRYRFGLMLPGDARARLADFRGRHPCNLGLAWRSES